MTSEDMRFSARQRLKLAPLDRLRVAVAEPVLPATIHALEIVSLLPGRPVVIGSLAAVLQGAPVQLRHPMTVEVLAQARERATISRDLALLPATHSWSGIRDAPLDAWQTDGGGKILMRWTPHDPAARPGLVTIEFGAHRLFVPHPKRLAEMLRRAGTLNDRPIAAALDALS